MTKVHEEAAVKSRTLPSFWDTYVLLPEPVKKAARKQFLHWRETPFHPSLHFKCVNQEEQIWSEPFLLPHANAQLKTSSFLIPHFTFLIPDANPQ